MDSLRPFSARHSYASSHSPSQGFTLIEVMVVVAIVAILAAIAIPSYQQYIRKSRAQSAAADLNSLSLAIENRFQKTLAYPTTATTTTAATTAQFTTWNPGQTTYFDYTYTPASPGYVVTATAKSGSLSGCVISLSGSNVRSATSTCGFTTW